MKPICIIFCIVLACLTKVQGQSYQWLTGGGSGTMMPGIYLGEGWGDMCVGKDGNIYALTCMGGFFGITADTFHRPSAWGEQINFFVCSYSPDGHMRWGKLIGSNIDRCVPDKITCDTLGHVYVIGSITNGTSHIGSDTTMSVYNYNRNCIIQFDTAGHFKWIHFPGANTMATLLGSSPAGVFIDGLAHPHFLARFNTGVQITPSIAALSGVYDLEYDISGGLISVTRLAFDSNLTIRKCILNKSANRLYAIGERYSFTPANSHGFVAAFDADRNLLWKDTLRSANPSISKSFSDLKESDGYLYLSGIGGVEVSFQADTVKNSLTPGFVLGLVAKVDTAGNGVWMKGISGSIGVGGINSLCMLDDHKLAVVGTMAGKQKYGTDSLQTYTGEGQNPMFAIMDTSGDLFTLQQLHGNGFYDGLWHCAADRNGALYMRGYVESQVWAGSLTPYASVGGSSDYYIMKYGAGPGCAGGGPVAAFTATGTHTVSFTYTAPTAGMDSVRWFFGDGGTSTVWNPTHVYAASGTYHVYVRVYSYCGGDVKGKDIVITCPAIAAPAFTGAGGMTKIFTYTASATGADSVRWRFGDGGTSTAWNPTHTYAANGIYTVCVTVWNWCSRDSLCDTVHVSGLGVAGLEQASWRVLPNPANEYLEVHGAAGAVLQVYDLPGRAVLEAQVSSNNEH